MLACVSAPTAPSHVFTNKVASYSNPFLSPPSVASSSGPREYSYRPLPRLLRCMRVVELNLYIIFIYVINNVCCV